MLIRKSPVLRNDPPQLGRIDSAWKSDRNDDFTAFSAVFQSYQDDRRVIMKRCVQWNPVHDCKDIRLRQGSNLGPLDQIINVIQ